MWMRVSSTPLPTTHHPFTLEVPLYSSALSLLHLCLYPTLSLLSLFLAPIPSPSRTPPLILLNPSPPPLRPTEDRLLYNAQSPDEAALVGAAKNFGYIFAVSIIAPVYLPCQICPGGRGDVRSVGPRGPLCTIELTDNICYFSVHKLLYMCCANRAVVIT